MAGTGIVLAGTSIRTKTRDVCLVAYQNGPVEVEAPEAEVRAA